jgi:predicted DsbA family dithiol-disulfide isomerase
MRAARPLFLALIAAVACGKSKSNEPVARFGNKTITVEDLGDDLSKRLKELEARLNDAKRDYAEGVYQAKRGALEKKVQDELFAQMAKEKNITVEQARDEKFKEFVDKVPAPTPEEARAFYDQKQREMGGRLEPYEQLEGQVIEAYRAEKAGPEAMAWYENAKKEKGFELLLEPYRVEVDAKGPSKGGSKASVTIVEFSDFQCPYCAKIEPTVAKVLEDYGDKVKLVYKDFPLDFHKEAQKASEAAHCADEQGKYWEMHTKLFADQNALDVASLKKHARELSLDGEKFDKCLDSGAKEKLVKASYDAGVVAGVRGTPAFFVNGRPVNGGEVDDFKKIIDEELARN